MKIKEKEVILKDIIGGIEQVIDLMIKKLNLMLPIIDIDEKLKNLSFYLFNFEII